MVRTENFVFGSKMAAAAVEVIWQYGPVQLVQSQGMLFTTKHVIYQVKVHLTWLGHFPTLSAPVPYQPVHLTWVCQRAPDPSS